MNGKTDSPGEKPPVRTLRARPWRGLSGKVLLLTVLFVMVGEVLIFLPSISNFRITWLKNKIATAEIAALVVEAAPENQVADSLRRELLKGAGVKVIALKRDQTRSLMLKADGDLMIAETYDLREKNWITMITGAFRVLTTKDNRLIGVVDVPPNMSGQDIEIALNEAPLRAAMIDFSFRILTLSVLLSLIVASLVFLALNRTLVRPMRSLARNMLRFGESPENEDRIIRPSRRADEIGIAERELETMQRELASTLQQKNRLAALGLAVSKVSHDLRNMLASAQLISDRLSMVDDPTVQKFTPKLISSLDRAIDFCAQTLKFGRVQEAPPKREMVELRPLVEEAIDTAVVDASSQIILYNNVVTGQFIDADREQLYRILMNLVRNAVQALETAVHDGVIAAEGTVRVKSWREGAVTTIEIRDNGAGVSKRAREHLFEAFRGSARAGGTGLGLSISSELARAHGGEISLRNSADGGAVFWIVIPDRVAEIRPGKRGRRSTTPAA